MAETPLQNELAYSKRRPSDWGAIWGGVFVFTAIWAVFESLALAIFGTANMGPGMAIWTIVLTIIAMYIGARQTSRLAAANTKNDGLMLGMMMFGLSFVSALVLTTLTSLVLGYGATTTAGTHGLWAIGLTHGMAWTGFLTLFLGWLAALGGATSGVERSTVATRPAVEMRPAA